MAQLVGDSGLFTITEFRNRGVIKLAPDALVYISGDLETRVLAPVQGIEKNVSFNDGITSVSVQNNIDPPGSSSASIEITTPIYGPNSNYWVGYETDGKKTRIPILVPMMEVRIFFKGRYLVNEEPKYYPSFWGFINGIEENYSGGSYKITVQCVDMLHWWAYSQINIHPVPESNIALGGGQTLTAFKTIFRDANPFTIIYRLTNDIFVPPKTQEETFESAVKHSFVSPTWVGQKTPLSNIYPPKDLFTAASNIMKYWKGRFGNFGSILKMYGAKGDKIPIPLEGGFTINFMKPGNKRSLVVSDTSDKKRASESMIINEFDLDESLNQFSTFHQFDQMGEFTEAEYMSKLEIATVIKNMVEFEFFQDVNGNFIFKPPFYNVDVRQAEPYIIRPYDVISFSSGIDSEAIVTVLQVTTPFYGKLRSMELPQGIGFHMDIELAQKYGIRFKEINLQYIKSSAPVATQLALGHLGMINAKASTGSVTIPGRPEIRLGYPIYLDHRDSFHYVKSINHSFDYGGSFTTTLSLEAERRRMFDENGNARKDKIYLFDKELQADLYGLTENDVKKQEALRSKNRWYSTEQGRYKIVDRTPGSREMLSVTTKTVPFTDEDGYRLIGSFTYGRGIVLTSTTTIDGVSITESKKDAANANGEPVVTKYDPIVSMAPESSIRESQVMGDFFSRVPEDQDSAIPGYLNTTNFRLDINQQSNKSESPDQVTNMTPENQENVQSSALVNQAGKW